MKTSSVRAALLTVYFHTPQHYKQNLMRDCKRLGLDLYSVDATYDNRGYAAHLNDLLRSQKRNYEVFFLANPDISLARINRQDILAAADHFDIWGYTMQQNGTVYYGGEVDKWRMSGGLLQKKPSQRFVECDFVSGSLMGVKSSTIDKIGYLDESYFMYYEDVEYCIRARKKGLKVGIDSKSCYEHFETSDANSYKQKWLARNRIKVLLQHGNWQQKLYELIRLPKTLLEDGHKLF